MRRFRLRTRLLAALGVPIAVMIAVAGTATATYARQIATAHQAHEVVAFAAVAEEVVRCLADESAAAVAGTRDRDSSHVFEDTARACDSAFQTLSDRVDAIGHGLAPSEAKSLDRLVRRVTSVWTQIRSQVRDGQDGLDVESTYLRLVADIAQMPEVMGQGVDERAVSEHLAAHAAVLRFAAASYTTPLLARDADPGGAAAVRLARGDMDAQLSSLGISWGPRTDSVDLAAEVRDSLTRWSDARMSDARRRMVLVGVGLATATGVSVAVAAVIARSVIAPVERLRAAVLQQARVLPQQVRDATRSGRAAVPIVPAPERGELRDLWRAFSIATGTAVELASEQALHRERTTSAIAAIARRDAVLVERQLALLDAYERDETDPVALSHLFALDHLATCQRRNINSLLVIAGAPRIDYHRTPMSMTDILRAAASQIEQYTRVELRLEVDPVLHAHLCGPAIHLFSELLDNATRYSPPNTPVTVACTKHAEGAQVVIRDEGIGLDERQLRDLNRVVSSPPDAELGRLDRLGLPVVARLRGSLGARVTLVRTPSGAGVQVEVVVPSRAVAGGLTGPPPLAVEGEQQAGATVSVLDLQHATVPERVRQAVRLFRGYSPDR